jgi:glucose/arabinose dehydrogenase
MRNSSLWRRCVTGALLPALALVLFTAGAGPASAATVGSSTVLSGLAMPDALALAKDGRVFIGEQKTGRILLRQPTGTVDTFFTVPGNQDLYGLTVHPAFPATPFVYAYGNRIVRGQARLQLLRLRMTGTVGTGLTVLRDFGPRPADHWGGRLTFGPDGMLYLVIGDGGVPANAQLLNNPFGKMLRMTATGGIPAGNPFGNRIFAYGIRISFGFAFDPGNGRLWESENGPECNDEVNRLTRGGNFGWGSTETCATPPDAPRNTSQSGRSPVQPQTWYAATTAPTGLAVCSTCGLGAEVEGNVVYGTYKTNQLRRIVLDPNRSTAVDEQLLLQHTDAVLAVERAPGGALWFTDTTSVRTLTLQ